MQVIYPKSSRNHDWVSEQQVKAEFPYFYVRILEISTWGQKAQETAGSIYQYMKDEGLVTWKQFDLIMNLRPSDRYIGDGFYQNNTQKNRGMFHTNLDKCLSGRTAEEYGFEGEENE